MCVLYIYVYIYVVKIDISCHVFVSMGSSHTYE